MTKWNWEYTDTFGGEANYCWVRRGTIEMPEKASNRAVIRAAKKAAEVSIRHKPPTDYGDTIRLDFYGACVVLFITPDY